MSNNKVTTYLLYAIGEIVLVVIGIIIAVQLNNWNQNRIQQENLRISLTSLSNELAADTVEIRKELERSEIEFQHSDFVFNRIKSKAANLDTLIQIAKNEFRIHWVVHIDYNTSSYENMKSSGSFDILPHSLKQEITSFYNSQEKWKQISDKTFNQYQSRFDEYSETYTFKQAELPNAYISQTVWSDIDPKHFTPRFFFLVVTRRIMWGDYTSELRTMLADSRVLLASIEQNFD